MSGDLMTAFCYGAVCFIGGSWWGLYLNLSHWHRMRRWANRVADVHQQIKEA